MENPRIKRARQRQKEKYQPLPRSIKIVKEFLGKLGDPPRSNKSEYQAVFAFNHLAQIMQELKEQSQHQGNQDRAPVIRELADLLYAAYAVAEILIVPFHPPEAGEWRWLPDYILDYFPEEDTE